MSLGKTRQEFFPASSRIGESHATDRSKLRKYRMALMSLDVPPKCLPFAPKIPPKHWCNHLSSVCGEHFVRFQWGETRPKPLYLLARPPFKTCRLDNQFCHDQSFNSWGTAPTGTPCSRMSRSPQTFCGRDLDTSDYVLKSNELHHLFFSCYRCENVSHAQSSCPYMKCQHVQSQKTKEKTHRFLSGPNNPNRHPRNSQAETPFKSLGGWISKLKLKHQNDNINYPLQSMIFFTIKKITFKTMSIAFFSNGKVHKGSKYVKMIQWIQWIATTLGMALFFQQLHRRRHWPQQKLSSGKRKSEKFCATQGHGHGMVSVCFSGNQRATVIWFEHNWRLNPSCKPLNIFGRRELRHGDSSHVSKCSWNASLQQCGRPIAHCDPPWECLKFRRRILVKTQRVKNDKIQHIFGSCLQNGINNVIKSSSIDGIHVW